MIFLALLVILLTASLQSITLQSLLYQQDMAWLELESHYAWRQVHRETLKQEQRFYALRRRREPQTRRPDHPRESGSSSQGPRLRYRRLVPANARLPIGDFFLRSPYAEIWQTIFWKLLHELYHHHPPFASWLAQVERREFMEDLIQEIARLSDGQVPLGSWSLGQIRLRDPISQEIWAAMIEGSDRYYQNYPSLVAYLWPITLSRSTAVAKINLPYASEPLLIAVAGREFATQWQDRVAQALHQLGAPADTKDLLLTKGAYQKILEELLLEHRQSLPLPWRAILEIAPGPWHRVPEILIRQEGCYDVLIPSGNL